MDGQHFLLGYFKLDAIFLIPPFVIFKKKINVINVHTTPTKGCLYMTVKPSLVAKAQEIIEAFFIRVLRNGTS